MNDRFYIKTGWGTHRVLSVQNGRAIIRWGVIKNGIVYDRQSVKITKLNGLFTKGGAK